MLLRGAACALPATALPADVCSGSMRSETSLKRRLRSLFDFYVRLTICVMPRRAHYQQFGSCTSGSSAQRRVDASETHSSLTQDHSPTVTYVGETIEDHVSCPVTPLARAFQPCGQDCSLGFHLLGCGPSSVQCCCSHITPSTRSAARRATPWAVLRRDVPGAPPRTNAGVAVA